jgi:hypothetical protein
VTVAVSVIGVSVGRGSRVAVRVGSPVDVIVIVAVSGGRGVLVSVNVGGSVSKILGVEVGCTIGRMVGSSPMQAASMPPRAPISAATIRGVLLDDVFLSVIKNS